MSSISRTLCNNFSAICCTKWGVPSACSVKEDSHSRWPGSGEFLSSVLLSTFAYWKLCIRSSEVYLSTSLDSEMGCSLALCPSSSFFPTLQFQPFFVPLFFESPKTLRIPVLSQVPAEPRLPSALWLFEFSPCYYFWFFYEPLYFQIRPAFRVFHFLRYPLCSTSTEFDTLSSAWRHFQLNRILDVGKHRIFEKVKEFCYLKCLKVKKWRKWKCKRNLINSKTLLYLCSPHLTLLFTSTSLLRRISALFNCSEQIFTFWKAVG